MKKLDLNLAADARQYIDECRVNGEKPSYVQLNGGRVIYFKDMTDEEAIFIADNLARILEPILIFH